MFFQYVKYILAKKKTNGEACYGIQGECDESVGISCLDVNGVKKCS